MRYYHDGGKLSGRADPRTDAGHSRRCGNSLWLDPDNKDIDLLQQLIQPYPDDLMRVYPVSKDANKVSNGDSGLIEPIVNSA